MLFKNEVQKQYHFLVHFITLLFILFIIEYSTLESLSAIAQEELEILVNEDEVISETGEDTGTNDEVNQNEDKQIKLDTTSSSAEPEPQNIWSDIIILVVGIGVAVFLYFLIKHLIKRAAQPISLF